MENQSMPSSSSSSSPQNHDQKLKGIVVASEEKEEMKNLEQRSPQEIVSERTVSETPSFDLSIFRTESMKTNPPTDNEVFICHPCERGFKSRHALSCHRGHHKVDGVLKRKAKKPLQSFSIKPSHQEKSKLLFGGYSQDITHPGLSMGPLYFKEGSGSGKSSILHQLPKVGLSKGFTDFMNRTWASHRPSPYPYSTMNTSYSSPSSYEGLSSGPFTYGGGGSGSNSNSSANLLFNVIARGLPEKKTTMLPPSTPDRFLTGNNRYSTSSRDHLPSYCSSHAFLNDDHLVSSDSYQGLYSGLFLSGGDGSGSSSGITYPLFNGAATRGFPELMKTAMFPPPTPDHFLMKNTSYNTSSGDPLPSYNCSSSDAVPDGINLELTLAPPNSSNNGSKSFDWEASRGTSDVIIPVRPRVSLYHFVAGNPLDSIITSIPSPPPPPPPPSPPSPPQTTNLANGSLSLEDNGASCSHSGSVLSEALSEDDEMDVGMIKWLSKKKRSPRSKSG